MARVDDLRKQFELKRPTNKLAGLWRFLNQLVIDMITQLLLKLIFRPQ